MFVLARLKDKVTIQPYAFDLPQLQAISEKLTRRYANRVVINVGLCICLYDIQHVDPSVLLPCTGAYTSQGERTVV